jgi:hypothetical protein
MARKKASAIQNALWLGAWAMNNVLLSSTMPNFSVSHQVAPFGREICGVFTKTDYYPLNSPEYWDKSLPSKISAESRAAELKMASATNSFASKAPLLFDEQMP